MNKEERVKKFLSIMPKPCSETYKNPATKTFEAAYECNEFFEQENSAAIRKAFEEYKKYSIDNLNNPHASIDQFLKEYENEN